jgi:hypothetical protein
MSCVSPSPAPAPFDPVTAATFSVAGGLVLLGAGGATVAVIPTAALLLGKAAIIGTGEKILSFRCCTFYKVYGVCSTRSTARYFYKGSKQVYTI